jgi:hypothetical protein
VLLFYLPAGFCDDVPVTQKPVLQESNRQNVGGGGPENVSTLRLRKGAEKIHTQGFFVCAKCMEERFGLGAAQGATIKVL